MGCSRYTCRNVLLASISSSCRSKPPQSGKLCAGLVRSAPRNLGRLGGSALSDSGPVSGMEHRPNKVGFNQLRDHFGRLSGCLSA